MSAIQNINKKLKQPFYFVSFAIILIAICFFTLIPKLTSTLYPQKRKLILNEFIQSIKKNHSFNLQKYWEFREFYSPGHFVFNRNGINKVETNEILISSNLELLDKTEDIFLKFSSPKLVSLDILTEKNTLQKAVDIKSSIKNIIYQDASTKIYSQNQNTIIILFLVPADKMELANGFFDYQNEDKGITNGKYWLNITKITTE